MSLTVDYELWYKKTLSYENLKDYVLYELNECIILL